MMPAINTRHLYFRVYEQVMFGDDELHFDSTDDAREFIRVHFVEGDSDSISENIQMYDEMHGIGSFVIDVEALNDNPDKAPSYRFIRFARRCYAAQGYEASIEYLELEPFPLYVWNSALNQWVMDTERCSMSIGECHAKV